MYARDLFLVRFLGSPLGVGLRAGHVVVGSFSSFCFCVFVCVCIINCGEKVSALFRFAPTVGSRMVGGLEVSIQLQKDGNNGDDCKKEVGMIRRILKILE